MRYLWLFALFAGHAAFAADDDARRCDAAGADAFDPLRPADVPFRYYHPFYADVAAMKADVAACQRAFGQAAAQHVRRRVVAKRPAPRSARAAIGRQRRAAGAGGH